ncbi:MAG: hypothetical protein HKL87_02385 [Acidimicrobiaceae bacterium]|nr:hypothetical protein [Acidimicrobiaceae bacterium]
MTRTVLDEISTGVARFDTGRWRRTADPKVDAATEPAVFALEYVVTLRTDVNVGFGNATRCASDVPYSERTTVLSSLLRRGTRDDSPSSSPASPAQL